jgi:hypothetical protein
MYKNACQSTPCRQPRPVFALMHNTALFDQRADALSHGSSKHKGAPDCAEVRSLVVEDIAGATQICGGR